MEQVGWTIGELAARVAVALDGAAYAGAPNGRVRDVPDARAIRWYATIGLVDRPGAMRGRTALYGPRHLLQLVAVKRRQAEGRRIAEIQAELTGAPDDVLRAIAELPDSALEAPPVEVRASEAPAPDVPPRPRFWAERPASTHQIAAQADRSELSGVHLNGMHLEGGAVLLLPAAPNPDDVSAILSAARPLLDVLAARGLLSAQEIA